MIEETGPNSTDNRRLSSETIRNNFRSPQKERHIGLKIGVIVALLILGWFISIIINQKPYTGDAPSVTLNDSLNGATKDKSDDKSDKKNDQQAINPNKSIYVKGRNKDDLRKKLLALSESMMQNQEYTPVNASLNANSLRFSCDLIKKPSPYIKISFVYGPQTTGCEACDNVLIKNPGSKVLAKVQDSDFIYNVIAIAQ